MERRHWGVNLAGVVASVLMLGSMFYPWWAFRWEFVAQTDIYTWLVDGPGSEFVGYRRSPQMTLLTVVMAVTILVCLLGSLLRGRSAKIMMIASGTLALLACWRLIARVSGVAARFDLPVVGHGWGHMNGFAQVEVWTWLQPGFYMVVAGGILAVLAGLLHSKIRLEN